MLDVKCGHMQILLIYIVKLKYDNNLILLLFFLGFFCGLDYPYGSRTIAPYTDIRLLCLLEGGSEVQP